MQKHFPRVNQAKLDGKSLQIQLFGPKHLTLEKFSGNGIWYTGFHDISPLGTIIPMSGMNFAEDEWDKLMELLDEINLALKEERIESQGVKRDVNGKEIVRDVLMYKWKWMVGKKKVGESDIGFFSEEDCKRDASSHRPDSDKGTVVIETVWGPPPKKYVHIHEVFLHILKTFIDKLVKERCEGCKVESQSQKDHMGPSGCLVEDVDYLVEYCQEALEKISPSDLVTLYEKSRREIGACFAFSDLSVETVVFYMDQETAIHYMKKCCNDTRNLLMVLERC